MGNCYWDFKSKAQRSTAKISILIGKTVGNSRKYSGRIQGQTEKKRDEPTKKEGETKRITLENKRKNDNSWEIAIGISKAKRNDPQQK